MQTNVCATRDCERPARWYSIPEGNTHGNNAPRRCAACCNAIDEVIADDGVIARLTQEHEPRAGNASGRLATMAAYYAANGVPDHQAAEFLDELVSLIPANDEPDARPAFRAAGDKQ